jgi:uncharacterized damage-inducible protein DinB
MIPMTNKEFFIATWEAELPVFLRVMKAVPQDKVDFKPHEKARTAGSIVTQLAQQPRFTSAIVTKGVPDFSEYKTKLTQDVNELAAIAEKNFAQLKADVAAISDADWENGAAVLTYPGGKWETKKYDMAWGFLFDGIHHRGQLTTYLRAMGAKVPSVYGGSADVPPSS